MRFWQPLFPLIPAHLWCLSLKDVNLGLSFILLQHFFSATWLKQFIHHRRQLYFHPTGMSLTVCERAAKIRPVTGYRRGLCYTHPVCPAPLHAWPDLMTHFPLALPVKFLPVLLSRGHGGEAGRRWRRPLCIFRQSATLHICSTHSYNKMIPLL